MSLNRLKQWTHRVTIIILFSLVQLAHTTAFGQATHPKNHCPVKAHRNWSGTEKWVWNNLCVGEVADLNIFDGPNLDPAVAKTRIYFYFHKVVGYVLASFLIAGLSGITK